MSNPATRTIRTFNADAVLPPRQAPPFARPESLDPSAPVDLEIGCGVGWHPIRYAGAHPDRFLIAIEHTRSKFERFQSRLQKHPAMTNLMAVHADAIAWVTHELPPATISSCFLLYPNPEMKAPNRRWFRMPFLQRLLGSLRPDGELILATNEAWYADEAIEFALRAWPLELASDSAFDRNHPPAGGPRTHFEKKYLERGEICRELRFVFAQGENSVSREPARSAHVPHQA